MPEIIVPMLSPQQWETYKVEHNLPQGSTYDSKSWVVNVPETVSETTQETPVAEQESQVVQPVTTKVVPMLSAEQWENYKIENKLPEDSTYDPLTWVVTIPEVVPVVAEVTPVVTIPIETKVSVEVPPDYTYSEQPYDVIVKMANEGASIAELRNYAAQHPDAIRGAYAGRLNEQIQAQIVIASELEGEEQFNAYKELGLIDKDAQIVKNEDGTVKLDENGNWSYTTAGKEFAPQSFGLTQTERDYIAQNYPEVSSMLEEKGLGYTWGKYADVISNAKIESQLSPTELSIFKEAGGGKNGIDAVIISQLTPQELIIYNEKGGGIVGLGEVNKLRIETDNQVRNLQNTNKQNISAYAIDKNIQISDINNPTNDEIRSLIENGLDPKTLVFVYTNRYDDIKNVVDDLQIEYQQYLDAKTKLEPYADKVQNPNVIVDIETGKYYDVSDPLKPIELPTGIDLYTTFNTAQLAKYLRDNPDGIETLKNYNFDQVTIDNAIEYNNVYPQLVTLIDEGFIPTGSGLTKGLGASSSLISAVGRAAEQTGVKPVEGSYVVAWRNLDYDTKLKIAEKVAQDSTKESFVGSLAADIDRVASINTAMSLISAPIQPITHVIGKQVTIEQAREILSEQYKNELDILRDYISENGTIDIQKIDDATDGNKELRDKLVKETGYEDYETLKENLEYYNNGIRVTGEEWRIAGATTALDVLSLGAGGALSGLGRVGSLIEGGVLIGSAAVFAPSAYKVVTSSDASIGEKALATGGTILLLVGGGFALKGVIKPSTIVKTNQLNNVVQKVIVDKPSLNNAINAQINNIGNVSRIAKTAVTVERILDNIKLTGDYLRYGLKVDTINALRNSRAFINELSSDVVRNIQRGIITTENELRAFINNTLEVISKTGDYIRYGLKSDTINALRSSEAFVKELSSNLYRNLQRGEIAVENKIRSLVLDELGKLKTPADYLRYGLKIDTINAIRNSQSFISDLSSKIGRQIELGLITTENELRSFINNTLELMQKTGDYARYGLEADTINALRNSKEFINNLVDSVYRNVETGIIKTENAIRSVILDELGNIKTPADYLKYGLKVDTINALRSSQAFLRDLSIKIVKGIDNGLITTENELRSFISERLDGLAKTGDYLRYGLKIDTINALRENNAFVKDLASSIYRNIQSKAIEVENTIRSVILDELGNIKTPVDYLKYGLKVDTINALRSSESFIKDMASDIAKNIENGRIKVENDLRTFIRERLDDMAFVGDYVKYGLKADVINSLRGSKSFIDDLSTYIMRRLRTGKEKLGIEMRLEEMRRPLIEKLKNVKSVEELNTLLKSSEWQKAINEYNTAYTRTQSYFARLDSNLNILGNRLRFIKSQLLLRNNQEPNIKIIDDSIREINDIKIIESLKELKRKIETGEISETELSANEVLSRIIEERRLSQEQGISLTPEEIKLNESLNRLKRKFEAGDISDTEYTARETLSKIIEQRQKLADEQGLLLTSDDIKLINTLRELKNKIDSGELSETDITARETLARVIEERQRLAREQKLSVTIDDIKLENSLKELKRKIELGEISENEFNARETLTRIIEERKRLADEKGITLSIDDINLENALKELKRRIETGEISETELSARETLARLIEERQRIVKEQGLKLTPDDIKLDNALKELKSKIEISEISETEFNANEILARIIEERQRLAKEKGLPTFEELLNELRKLSDDENIKEIDTELSSTLDDIDSFIRREKPLDEGSTEIVKTPEPPTKEGGGVAIKEKTETKPATEVKPKSAEELEKELYTEKSKIEPEKQVEKTTTTKVSVLDKPVIVTKDGIEVEFSDTGVIPVIPPEVLAQIYGGEALIVTKPYVISDFGVEKDGQVIYWMTPQDFVKEAEKVSNELKVQESQKIKELEKPLEQILPMEQPLEQPAPMPLPKPELVKQPYPQIEPILENLPEPLPEPLPKIEEPTKTGVKTKPILPKIEFEDDPEINKKLSMGFYTWRQGKTHWAIPQREDGTFDTEDKVSSGKPFRGTTKFATGKGSVYKTFEYVGKNPPDKSFIDIGWAQFDVKNVNGEMQITRINPDDTANWEGINKYTTPEAIAKKQQEERQQRELKRIANIERYKRQYMKVKPRKIKERNVYSEVDKVLSSRNISEKPEVIESNKNTYLGFEILPPQLGGQL